MRYAAIALVLRPNDEGDSDLLMIKRAEVERDPWSGHIACPGGSNGSDGSRPRAHGHSRDMGRDGHRPFARRPHPRHLDDITPRTPTLPPIVIRPFVAVVRQDVTIVESPEVAEAFWVPMAAIRETARWGKGLVPIRGVGDREVEVFRHGAYTVWG
jgi:hypothetical protein